jgi:hypothetical protein
MATCPSCGRYVGPTDAGSCPHCGARLAGRVTIHTLRIGALVLAMLGLGLLWWFATHSPIPALKIGQAQALTLDVMDVASRAAAQTQASQEEMIQSNVG